MRAWRKCSAQASGGEVVPGGGVVGGGGGGLVVVVDEVQSRHPPSKATKLRSFQGVVPSPILSCFVSVVAGSPSSSIGLALAQSARVPLLIWMVFFPFLVFSCTKSDSSWGFKTDLLDIVFGLHKFRMADFGRLGFACGFSGGSCISGGD